MMKQQQRKDSDALPLIFKIMQIVDGQIVSLYASRCESHKTNNEHKNKYHESSKTAKPDIKVRF